MLLLGLVTVGANEILLSKRVHPEEPRMASLRRSATHILLTSVLQKRATIKVRRLNPLR